MGQILFNVSGEDSGYSGPAYTFLLHASTGNDSQGVILEVGGTQNNLGGTFDDALKSTVLLDGRIAVFGKESGANSVKCFEAGSTTSVSWQTALTGNDFYKYGNIVTLTNGNIAVSWTDSGETVDYTGWYAILDSDGNELTPATRYDGDVGAYPEYDSMIELPDGGFAIIGDQYPGTDTDWLAIHDADGTQRAYVQPTAESYDYGRNRLNVFPDGIIARFYSSGNSLYTFNSTTGTEIISGGSTFSAVNTNDTIISAALSTWTDKLAVFFTDNVNDLILGTIIHSDGTHPDVYDKTVYTKYDWAVPFPVDVVVTQDDQFVLVFDDRATTHGYGNYYVILDSNLDVLAADQQAFTGVSARADYGYLEGCAI